MMELSSGATIDAGVITGGVGGSYDDTAIKADIADLQADITNINTDITTVKNDLATAKTDIDTLEADVDSLEGKEIDTLTYANSELTLTAKDTTTKTVTIKPNLVDLGDVDITSPNSGDVVTYSASTGKFTTRQVLSTDQYVKMTASDTNAGYLADLIDDDTIKNNGGKLEVEKIKGQNITVDELNTLVGMNTNVKDSLNALASGGMVFKDVVPTYADLPNSAVNGFVYIVNADETDNGNRNAYIYSDDHAGFVLVGTSGLEVRNFTANPIDLTSEVTNVLPKDKMDTADLVDKTKDVINTLSYPIPDSDLAKVPNLAVLKQINTEVINALNGKVNTTDIVDNLTSTDTDKPLSANQGKVLKGELNKKAEIDDTQASADKTYSSNKIEGKIPFKFGIDGEGNYGYFKADDSFVPFSRYEFIGGFMFVNSITLPKKGIYLVTSTSYSSNGMDASINYATLKTVSNGVFEQIYHGESATGGYAMKVYKITTNSDNVICTYNSNTQLSVMKIS